MLSFSCRCFFLCAFCICSNDFAKLVGQAQRVTETLAFYLLKLVERVGEQVSWEYLVRSLGRVSSVVLFTANENNLYEDGISAC